MLELNKIYNMDCLEGMKLIDSQSIDCVITDPPYGINIVSNNGTIGGNIDGIENKIFKNFINDDKALSLNEINELRRISKNQIIFGGNYISNNLPASSCWIIWNKRSKNSMKNNFADCELAWTSFKQPSRVFTFQWMGMLRDSDEFRYHPTQKPLNVMLWIIENFTNKTDIICDPYSGSGSTLLACSMLDRKFIGFEIDKYYCDIADKRLNSLPKKLINFM